MKGRETEFAIAEAILRDLRRQNRAPKHVHVATGPVELHATHLIDGEVSLLSLARAVMRELKL